MTGFKISIPINKPADIVTDALNNPENFPYWQTDLKKFEILGDEPNQVGSVGRLHYSQKGRSYIMEDKLIYCEPGKRYISKQAMKGLETFKELVEANGTNFKIIS